MLCVSRYLFIIENRIQYQSENPLELKKTFLVSIKGRITIGELNVNFRGIG